MNIKPIKPIQYISTIKPRKYEINTGRYLSAEESELISNLSVDYESYWELKRIHTQWIIVIDQHEIVLCFDRDNYGDFSGVIGIHSAALNLTIYQLGQLKWFMNEIQPLMRTYLLSSNIYVQQTKYQEWITVEQYEELLFGKSDESQQIRELINEYEYSSLKKQLDDAKENQEKIRQSEIKTEKIKNKKLIRDSTFIYLMKDHTNGFIKIGHSGNPRYRERTLQSEKPVIKLLIAWEGTMDEEKILHQQYGSQRIRGEWFQLSDVNIEEIKNRFSGRKTFQESNYND